MLRSKLIALAVALWLPGLISATPTRFTSLVRRNATTADGLDGTVEASGSLSGDPTSDTSDLGSAKALTQRLTEWVDDDGFLAVTAEIKELAANSGLQTAANSSVSTMLDRVAADPTQVHALAPQIDTELDKVVASSRRDVSPVDGPLVGRSPNNGLNSRAGIPKFIKCSGRIYLADFISKTLKKGCDLLTENQSVGVGAYPHRYFNIEKIFGAGKYQEYPIKTSRVGGVWEDAKKQGGPGLDRVVFTANSNGVCEFVGIITHKTFVGGAIASDKFFPC